MGVTIHSVSSTLKVLEMYIWISTAQDHVKNDKYMSIVYIVFL